MKLKKMKRAFSKHLLFHCRTICSKLQSEPNEPSKLTVAINYKLDLTMFDRKVINALTSTASSQSCNVCSVKPTEMNNIKLIRSKPVNKKALFLGLSPLHCWMRCFEYILHLGYKMKIRSFYAKTSEQKESIKERKTIIQRRFREELSLFVDMPKQGFGNTNDDPIGVNSEVSLEALNK